MVIFFLFYHGSDLDIFDLFSLTREGQFVTNFWDDY